MEKQRTMKQNAALHVYANWLAAAMDAQKLDMREVVMVRVPPTAELVKDLMIKPLACWMYPTKTSTTQLTTEEIQDVYQMMDKIIQRRFGMHVPWPNKQGPKP